VRKLSFFETPFRAPEAEQIAASPHLLNLRELHIGFTDSQIGPRGAAALGGAKALRRLEQLNVDSHAVYDRGAECILQLPRLRTIDLGNNGLTDETPMALAKADRLTLASLNLDTNHLTGRGVALLAGATHLAGVEHLSLHGNPIGYLGVTHLAEALFVGRLRTLRVSDCGLDDRALAALLGVDFPSVTELSLARNSFGEQAAGTLAGSRLLRRVHTLSVASCGIGRSVTGELGRLSLPELGTLHIGMNPLGSGGVQVLFDGPLTSTVRHLDLGATELGDTGAEVVAGSPVMVNVRWLELGENHITDGGAIALAESPFLAGVQSLDLSRNEIGPKGKEALTQRFGGRVRV